VELREEYHSEDYKFVLEEADRILKGL
jgi:hypothetical protein